MPVWKIVAIVLFVLLSLQNIRMAFIYLGVVKSAVIGPIFDIAFALNQLRALVMKIGFIGVVWLVDWPKVLVYMMAVWTVINALDFLRVAISIGTVGEIIMGVKQTPEGHRNEMIGHAVQFCIALGILWAMARFIGF